MKKKAELWKICKEIYREMFKEATPSVDFDKMVESGEAKKPEFFMKYYLSMKRQDDIINKFCKKYNIKGLEKRAIIKEVYLGCSPNSYNPKIKERV